MKLSLIAIVAALLALLAAVQVQYGPEWKRDAAVQAAIARGDLSRSREIATTAEHWAWILDARFGTSGAHRSPSGSDRVILVGDRDANRKNVSDNL